MYRTSAPIVALVLSLGLAGCYDSYEEPIVSRSSIAPMAESQTAGKALMRSDLLASSMASDGSGAPPSEAGQQRKIAQSQQWVFELKAEALEPVWQAHRDICLALEQSCEIVQASISRRGPGEGADFGNIDMRVDHAAFDRFLASIQKAGPAPIETSIVREDRTLQRVDLQSRLENAQSLRDRLQDMIKQADQGHKLSDLLALERELNRVQSTIDSMQSQSRVMAQQTDKVRMTFNYRSAPQTVVRDIWDPIRHAWHNMTGTFSRSVGDVMLFIAATVPWLVVLIPGWIFGRWALRRVFARWLKRP